MASEPNEKKVDNPSEEKIEKTTPEEKGTTKGTRARPMRLVLPAAVLAIIAAFMSRFSGLFGEGISPMPSLFSQNVIESSDSAASNPISPEINGEGGETASVTAVQSSPAAENTSQTVEEGEEVEEVPAIPDVIVVRIEEDQVTINGNAVKDAEELRQYIEEYNSDYRTFTLEEHLSILETYNWVKEVFVSMDIELKNSR